jgi:Tfp pilus assembly protein PilF
VKKRVRPTSRLCLLAVALLITACARPEAPPDRLPGDSGREQVDYALKLLRRGDDPGAREHLERALELGAGRGTSAETALFLRDLAEVRLATGDGSGAAQAAELSLDRLGRLPLSANFLASDRDLFERLLKAVAAAGRGDVAELQALAGSDTEPRAADPWYLLGWVYERRSEIEQAREAYRRYLAASPEFDLLQRSALMREHAQQVIAG